MSDAREWLEDIHSCSSGDDTDPGAALHMTTAALLAVLDLHTPVTNLNTETAYCWQCGLLPYPCDTVRAIDKALGMTESSRHQDTP